MTIRIIDDELVLTCAEYNEYMAQYNELAARTQVCIDFEVWVRGLKARQARVSVGDNFWSDNTKNYQPYKPEDEGMRVWG